MSSHTPGPWTADRGPHGWHIGPQPDGVCTIFDNSESSTHPTQEANAALIACAPEMLAALKALLTVSLPHDISGQRFIDQARDVIAKAEGKR